MKKTFFLFSIFSMVAALPFSGCFSTAETDSEPEPEVPAPATAPGGNVAAFEAELESALASGNSELADYLAEYVLSVEELEAFVEKKYPAKSIRAGEAGALDSPAECAQEIRYTLARRLLREGKWAAARQYFPEDLLPIFNAYVAAIQRGYNAKLSDEARARGFWDAALIVRNDGDALFLAASGPIYVSGGEWEENPIRKMRFAENIASAEERSRAESRDISRFVNDRRFRAAMLARNAASLLPNNDERTARVLCTAGVWLRYRDPKTADSFYKSIVIRCPQTELGKHCSELRWFPPARAWTDEQTWDGAPAVALPPPESEEAVYDSEH